MAEYNWNDIIARLNKMIRYGTAPVGMKWIKTEEEFKAIPKVRVHESIIPPVWFWDRLTSLAGPPPASLKMSTQIIAAALTVSLNGTKSGTVERCSIRCGSKNWNPPRRTTLRWSASPAAIMHWCAPLWTQARSTIPTYVCCTQVLPRRSCSTPDGSIWDMKTALYLRG